MPGPVPRDGIIQALKDSDTHAPLIGEDPPEPGTSTHHHAGRFVGNAIGPVTEGKAGVLGVTSPL